MMIGLDKCEFCGSVAHHWFNCPRKPDGWKPERLMKGAKSAVTPAHNRPAQRAQGPDKSTAARKDVPSPNRPATRGALEKSISGEAGAGTQALPVDTAPKRGKGRPKSITDMKAYKAQKERERRAAAKDKP